MDAYIDTHDDGTYFPERGMLATLLMPFLACLIVLPILFWFTRVQDAPSGGIPRLVLSAPAVWLIAESLQHPPSSAHVFVVFLFVALVLLWVPFFSQRFAVSFTRFLHSVPVRRGAFRPNYDEARYAASQGRLKEAMELIQDELDKSPTDFEGLMLLASGYQALEEPERAMTLARRISRNPMACPEQKEAANHVYNECLSLQHKLQLQGRPPKPIPDS